MYILKLLYGYFKNIDRNIHNQEINFSNEFTICYSQNKETKNHLIIKKTPPKIKNFFGNNIQGSTLLLGKNGSGKTSIMDLIGSNQKTIDNLFERTKYFFIYHISGDLFYFSGTIAKEIKNLFVDNDKYDRDFLFKLEKYSSKTILKVVKANKNDLIKVNTGIFYIRNETNFKWSPPKRIFKGGKEKYLKYFNINHKFEDILKLYFESDFVESKNRQAEIHQKIVYPKDQRYLAILNNFNFNDFDRNSEEFLFIKSEKLNELKEVSRQYSTKRLESRFDNCEDKRNIFFFRLFEKMLLNTLVTIEKKRTTKDFKTLQDIFFTIKSYQHKLYDIGINGLIWCKFDDEDLENKLLALEVKINNLSKEKLIKLTNKQYKLLENNFIKEYSIPDNYYSNNEIKFPTNSSNYEGDLTTLFTQFPGVFTPKLSNLSDGELVYLDIYSKVYRSLKLSSDQDAIILLDEPDSNLHPEWARCFISNLYKLINEEKMQGKVQVIVSSHSPFLSTDYPKENIYILNRNIEKNKVEISNPEFGFAANIYDLISNTFFLNAPIGEFALNKIFSLNEMTNQSEAQIIIDNIDDKLLKKILKDER